MLKLRSIARNSICSSRILKALFEAHPSSVSRFNNFRNINRKANTERIRTKPFTEEEKSILFNVIKAELNIIENKKTDATNSLKKHQAWERVEQKFRTYSHTHKRTAAQLKKCWENAKARRRKAEAIAHQKAIEASAESTVESSDREVDISLLLPYFRQQGNGTYDGDPDSELPKKEQKKFDGERDSEGEDGVNVECIIDDHGDDTTSNNHFNILPRILNRDPLPLTGSSSPTEEVPQDSRSPLERLCSNDDTLALTFQHQKDLHELRLRQYQLINNTAEQELATAVAESQRREALHKIAVRKAEAEEERIKELHDIAVRRAEADLLHRRRMNELEYQHKKTLLEQEVGKKLCPDECCK